jgi:hypothetical protein
MKSKQKPLRKKLTPKKMKKRLERIRKKRKKAVGI